MQAGKLRHKIELLKPELVSDTEYSDTTQIFNHIAFIFGAIEPLSVKDFIAGGGLQSQIKARIIIRFRKDVSPGWRIKTSNNLFEVIGILADKNSGQEYITLAVSEVLNE